MIEEFMIEEMEETGELQLSLLIPLYLKMEYGKILRTPISGFVSNYNIENKDFSDLKKRLIVLMEKLRLGLFRYKSSSCNSTLWEDNFVLESDKQTKEILSNQENWIGKKNCPGYFIAEKS